MTGGPHPARRVAPAPSTVAAAVLLSALYLLLRQRSWSLDGAIHTLASRQTTDPNLAGHLLLRPVAWAWTSLWSLGGPLTNAQRYDALELLFGAFGVIALTLLFALVRARLGVWPAWLALAGVAIMRCVERHVTTFDEKPLGMLLFAVAVWVTERTFARLAARGSEPVLGDVLGMGSAWVLAVAGHLQNAPFGVASALALATWFRGPARLQRYALLLLELGAIAIAEFIALVVVIHAGAGGWTALPRVADLLFTHRLTSPAPSGPAALAASTVAGWIKAFFLVDRMSPRWAPGAAAAGFALLVGMIAWGVRRRPDPLALALAGGSLGLMLLIPAARFFPDFGDSYTMVVLAAYVPLAAAPRAAIAVATATVLAVNLPAELSYAFPETTVQQELAGMIARQRETGLPWILLDELGQIDDEQGHAPIYYAMSESLRVERAGLATLPRGGCLLELPQPIDRDGRVRPGRVGDVQARLAEHGRRSEARRLVDPPRRVRSEFRVYGDYLEVAPAGSR